MGLILYSILKKKSETGCMEFDIENLMRYIYNSKRKIHHNVRTFNETQN